MPHDSTEINDYLKRMERDQQQNINPALTSSVFAELQKKIESKLGKSRQSAGAGAGHSSTTGGYMIAKNSNIGSGSGVNNNNNNTTSYTNNKSNNYYSIGNRQWVIVSQW